MNEIPKDILKSIFDKVNTDDTFSRRIGVKLIDSCLTYDEGGFSFYEEEG